MRLSPKQVQNQLDWTILDVEQEEWDQLMADLGVAAANGFPFAAAAAQDLRPDPEDWSAAGSAQRWRRWRLIVPIAAAVVMLLGLAGYGVWRTAEAGAARMLGDIANAVKLEEVTARAQGLAASAHESVQAVEFVNGSAMATVLVTPTLAGSGDDVQPEVRFYARTPRGWQRTEPVAAFWGSRAALDTASLHFAFGEKDRGVVEQAAPAAEALYKRLCRATGQDLAAGGLLTVEIVPGIWALDQGYVDGYVRMSSPMLYRVAPAQRGELFGLLLRQVLADAMFDAVAQQTAVKAQWQTMVGGFRSWLWRSTTVQRVPASETRGLLQLQRGKIVPMCLDDVINGASKSGTQDEYPPWSYPSNGRYRQEDRKEAAEQLIEYIAVTYGIDAVPKLLQGFAAFEDWESLTPAVLGVSAAELEAAWHASLR